MDVVLCVPPYALADQPSLGVSILKAGCVSTGLSAVVDYASVRLSDQLGRREYYAMSRANEYPFLGELTFASYAFPEASHVARSAIKKLIDCVDEITCWSQNTAGYCDLIKFPSQLLLSIERIIPQFLQSTCEAILKAEPRIVGLSSTFQQTNASLAIARHLRALRKDLIIVMGGANFDHPMGKNWAQHLPFVDFLFSGESDIAFPKFCQKVCTDRDFAGTGTCEVVTSEPIANLDEVPIPDYSDYMACLGNKAVDARDELRLFFESSRGCWWGAKNHCTFCGLNANGMTARYKTEARLRAELRGILHDYRPTRMHAADNIIPIRKKLDVATIIREDGYGPDYFYEVKSNLSEEEIRTLAAAKISGIQPGIESLSSSILKMMRKGISGAANVALLRNSLESGLYVAWNYIYGFPGEDAEEYLAVSNLIPFIHHLPPPEAHGVIRIDRYSPYFTTPAQFGLGEIMPFQQYDDIFPGIEHKNGIAYHFINRNKVGLLTNEKAHRKFVETVDEWKGIWQRSERPRLTICAIGEDDFLIEDTREVSKQRYTIVSAQEYATLMKLRRPSIGLAGIDLLLDNRWVIQHEGHYVSVVVDRSLARGTEITLRLNACGTAAPISDSGQSAASR